MSAPLGVILAGGQATRMGGGDKGRLALGDQTILDHVVARLEAQVSEIVLNANGDLSRFADLNLPVLHDPIPGYAGPLVGVLAGLDWAADRGIDSIVTVAADTPFFPMNLVDHLQATAKGMTTPLVLAATKRSNGDATRSMSRSGLVRHPTFGLWPVALRQDLRAAIEQGLRKVVLWTEKHDGREAVFEHEADPFFNVNTPEDLAHARQILEEIK